MLIVMLWISWFYAEQSGKPGIPSHKPIDKARRKGAS
jgi:hypothetical protein